MRARYERLSLLTLDLAEEAGEAAVSFSVVEKGDKKGRFERRIAAMTRCIWAHKEIERLRGGGEINKVRSTSLVTSPGGRDEEIAEEAHPKPTLERQVTIDAPAEIVDTEDPGYEPGYEIVYDSPAGGPAFDASVYEGAAIFDDDEIDEAGLEKAIKKALRDGKRGEEALKAALGIEKDKSDSVQAPP